jgi:hypothetical protein
VVIQLWVGHEANRPLIVKSKILKEIWKEHQTLTDSFDKLPKQWNRDEAVCIGKVH